MRSVHVPESLPQFIALLKAAELKVILRHARMLGYLRQECRERTATVILAELQD
jgi:hypothetical protein